MSMINLNLSLSTGRKIGLHVKAVIALLVYVAVILFLVYLFFPFLGGFNDSQ